MTNGKSYIFQAESHGLADRKCLFDGLNADDGETRVKSKFFPPPTESDWLPTISKKTTTGQEKKEGRGGKLWWLKKESPAQKNTGGKETFPSQIFAQITLKKSSKKIRTPSEIVGLTSCSLISQTWKGKKEGSLFPPLSSLSDSLPSTNAACLSIKAGRGRLGVGQALSPILSAGRGRLFFLLSLKAVWGRGERERAAAV